MKPPFRFHCFKCESSGVLNQTTLRDFSIFDDNLSQNIVIANKDFKSNGIQKINYCKKQVITPINNEISIRNTNYFNSRFNTNFTNEFISEKFKAITNPNQFFRDNKIFVGNSWNFDDSIGFLSSDSTHAIFRDVIGNQDRRYNNLKLVSDDDFNAQKMYNISTDIDVMNEEVTLIMTEGIFDIIGVYLHFYKDSNEENKIFAAACGKSFNAVISHYTRLGFLNLNVIIYSDADVPLNFYKNLKQSSPFIRNKMITIFYNDIGKDFGIKKEEIKLRKVIL